MTRTQHFRLPRELVDEDTLFMLRLVGDSMTGAAIVDGDLVIVRRQPAAENGEFVATTLDALRPRRRSRPCNAPAVTIGGRPLRPHAASSGQC